MIEQAALDARGADDVQPVERPAELEVTEEGEGAVEEAGFAVGHDERAVAAGVGDAAENVALETGGTQVGLADEGGDRGVVRRRKHQGVVARGRGDHGKLATEEAAEAGDEFVARGGDRRAGVFGDDDFGDRGGVGQAQRRVGEGIVAQPEAVAVVGAERGKAA